MRFKLLSGEDLMNQPPMRWIIRGILPAIGLAGLYGPSMSAKSFLAIDAGCDIASGEDSWFGYPVNKVPVTYVCLEGESGLRKRLNAWSKHHNKPIPEDLRFVTQSFNLLADEDINDLAKAIIAKNGQNGLVIIDTLNRAAPGIDENDSREMGNIIAACKKLQEMVGGLVLLVHHTGKDQTQGPRGHSSLFAALDGGIKTEKTENPRIWQVAKCKDGESGTKHSFRLEILNLGEDDEGEEVTSCVVVPCEVDGSTIKRRNTPSAANQKIIWNALGEMFTNSKCYGKGGAPETKACIEYDVAIEQAKNALPCDKKRQKERTENAITGLVSNGFLRHSAGWLWVP
jgi:putative DNA primase/helicase